MFIFLFFVSFVGETSLLRGGTGAPLLPTLPSMAFRTATAHSSLGLGPLHEGIGCCCLSLFRSPPADASQSGRRVCIHHTGTRGLPRTPQTRTTTHSVRQRDPAAARPTEPPPNLSQIVSAPAGTARCTTQIYRDTCRHARPSGHHACMHTHLPISNLTAVPSSQELSGDAALLLVLRGAGHAKAAQTMSAGPAGPFETLCSVTRV
jgi:hypothetical protein